jgi:4-amino-4-deoxy-L-arabinose transferase-like glycosyltransferase
VNDLRPTPARLTSAATLKLPRWGLLLLCLLYIVPGLIGRDPWKTDDAVGLGIMVTMAKGGPVDWIAPNIAGIPVAQEGPLAFWAGAVAIETFGWAVEPSLAARLSTVFWFLIASTSVWYATYLLGRRAETQPMALPFGGQPAPRDYGRMLADGALLLLLASWGILFRVHETSAEPALLACSAFVVYALVRGLDRPLSGAVQLGLVGGALFLSRGLWAALVPTFAVAWLAWRLRHADTRLDTRRLLTISLPLMLACAAAWLLPLAALDPAWLQSWWDWHLQQTGFPPLGELGWAARNLPWTTWPGLVFAGWSLWIWRHHRHAAHWQIPVAFLAAWLLSLLTVHDITDTHLLRLLPPLVILAAFALPTLRRGAVNALDWFALMMFTVFLALLWLGWIAMQTGLPPRIARNFARQTPGFTPEFSWVALTIALAGTAAWIALVVWRLRARPTVLWRGVVLSSGGLVVCHLLLTTLWMPAINYARTYRDVSAQLTRVLAVTGDARSNACVTAQNVGPAQLASFAYFNELRFSRQRDCPLLLLQDRVKNRRDDRLPPGRWLPVWEGHRASEPDERFRLFRKDPVQ